MTSILTTREDARCYAMRLARTLVATMILSAIGYANASAFGNGPHLVPTQAAISEPNDPDTVWLAPSFWVIPGLLFVGVAICAFEAAHRKDIRPPHFRQPR